MPPVPAVRGERVVRALERAGFKVARITGSHYVLRHPDGRGTTVPVHAARDVAKGTLRGISDPGPVLRPGPGPVREHGRRSFSLAS
jgi:predicted RNA binding protein YcfA (HicA-like mRNA interferase family)